MRSLFVSMLLCASAPALAGGHFDVFGTDARSKGMAGARTSTGGGAAAAYYNPAALGFTDRPEIGVSTSLSVPQLFIDTERELAEDSPISPRLPDAYSGYTVQFAYPFTGILEDWLTFGIVFYFPGQVLAHVRGYDPARPFFFMYDTYTDHYESSVGLSLELLPWLSLGGGVRYSAGQSGFVRLGYDPLRQRFTEQTIDAWQYSIMAPTAGLTVGPIGIEALTVQAGLSYQEELVTPLRSPVIVDFVGLDASLFAPLQFDSNFTPRIIAAGVSATSGLGGFHPALRPFGSLSAALDVSYHFWSATPPAFFRVGVQGIGEDFEFLGLSDILDAPGVGQERVRELGFADVVKVRAGVEYKLFDELLQARAGYSFRPSPIPDQTSGTNLIDNAVHAIAAGGTLLFGAEPSIDGKIRIDAAWQTHWLVPRSVDKVAVDDPIGGWTAGGFVHELSLATTYVF